MNVVLRSDPALIQNPEGDRRSLERARRCSEAANINRGEPPMTEVETHEIDSATDQQEQIKRQRRAEGERWLDTLLARDREGRIRMASAAVTNQRNVDRGRDCLMADHAARLDSMTAYLLRIGDTLADLRENCIPEMSEAGQAAATAVAKRLAAAAELFYP